MYRDSGRRVILCPGPFIDAFFAVSATHARICRHAPVVLAANKKLERALLAGKAGSAEAPDPKHHRLPRHSER